MSRRRLSMTDWFTFPARTASSSVSMRRPANWCTKSVPSRARHRGSPLLADGKLYLMGMDGTVTVLRAGRTFEVLAQNYD